MSLTTRFAAPGLFAVIAACSSSPPLTYEGAIAANARRPDAAQAQEWATSVLGPFWAAQMPDLLKSCLEPRSQDVPSVARLVIRLDRRRVSVPFEEGTSKTFTTCLSAAVQSLRWPQSPFEKLYLAVELNTKPPDPSAAAAEAEAIMDAMSRPNKSLERTRER
jgi:hypothetical protein